MDWNLVIPGYLYLARLVINLTFSIDTKAIVLFTNYASYGRITFLQTLVVKHLYFNRLN